MKNSEMNPVYQSAMMSLAMPKANIIPFFFLRVLTRWLLATASICAVAYFLPGFHVKNLMIAMIAAPTLAVLNMTLGLVLRFMTKPIIFFSLGLFITVINAVILWVTALLFGGSLVIDHFGWALAAAALIAVSNTLLGMPLRKRD